MRVLMVAAENDALTGAKVGGVADVVRDVPIALAEQGVQVDVVIPDYHDYLWQYNGRVIAEVSIPFRYSNELVKLIQISNFDGENNVTQYVIQHSLFNRYGAAGVYSHDGHNRPFASDATKFALFNKAVVECLYQAVLPRPDTLHLHDWHAATVAVLMQFAPQYLPLQAIRTVYTVHNLALQGTRPFQHDESSLEAWFPDLPYDGQQICDPHNPHCYNPMRAAISLCDKVHLVSPKYVEEVLLPSDHSVGFYGGEGLEHILQLSHQQHKLVGILNGCEYTKSAEPNCTTLDCFLKLAKRNVLNWISEQVHLKSVHYLASEQINLWRDMPTFSGPLVTSIGRLTEQKVRLLTEYIDGNMVLTHLLDRLDKFGGRLVILGSGDEHFENTFMRLMATHKNFLFLNGYGQSLSDDLYHLGDLFLMPSSFEPCGISQMLALRAGQPCLVHDIGGLSDTIFHNENGFVFRGDSIAKQSASCLETFSDTLSLLKNKPTQYAQIKSQAKQTRYTWQTSIKRYINELYN